jgi:hypothetical protein
VTNEQVIKCTEIFDRCCDAAARVRKAFEAGDEEGFKTAREEHAALAAMHERVRLGATVQ